MEAQTYSLMRDLEDKHWWFVARRQIIESVLRRLHLPLSANVLEVGCGTGGNLEMLSQFGNVTAIEQDSQAASLAEARNIAPVLAGALPDRLPSQPEPFDLIALFDVIEHVDEDQASLVHLKRLLRARGRIVLTVPAFNFLWSQHDVENHHKRRYRKKDIELLAKSCEMQVNYISYFNFWLFPPVAAIRLARNLVPYEESWQDMRLPSKSLNRILRFVFGSERHVVGRISLPFGISLLAVLSNSSSEISA